MTSIRLDAASQGAISQPTLQDTAALVGRALIAWLFIPSGLAKLMGFAGISAFIASKGVPFPEVCAAIAVAAELGCGLLVLAGWQARWAALGLVLFVAVITPVFHNYWDLPAAQAALQRQSFNKNVAIIGGLLLLAAFGPGRFSIGSRR
ncbi:MAG: DoxX family protein [Ramlibacter sp.]|nr:DoxX family protein [Ramlibacter sp.]